MRCWKVPLWVILGNMTLYTFKFGDSVNAVLIFFSKLSSNCWYTWSLGLILFKLRSFFVHPRSCLNLVELLDNLSLRQFWFKLSWRARTRQTFLSSDLSWSLLSCSPIHHDFALLTSRPSLRIIQSCLSLLWLRPILHLDRNIILCINLDRSQITDCVFLGVIWLLKNLFQLWFLQSGIELTSIHLLLLYNLFRGNLIHLAGWLLLMRLVFANSNHPLSLPRADGASRCRTNPNQVRSSATCLSTNWTAWLSVSLANLWL